MALMTDGNNLFNSTIRQNPSNMIFPTVGMGKFLNNWKNNPELVQKINNSPHNIGYSDEEITNYITQGLNFGVPEIAEAQRQWGIRTPKTESEIDSANEGIFNIYPTTQNKRIDKSMYLANPTVKNPDENNFLNRFKDRTKTGFSSFVDKFLGTPFQGLQPASNVVDENGNITLQTGTASGSRQGGYLKDFLSGVKENYNEDFSPNNWGQKKNWATRIGEGIGTLGRFTDSVPGRALIAGGLIGALGGNPAEMAAYGLTAGVGRQQNRLQDKVYRRDLINQAQNSLRNSEEFNKLPDNEAQQILDELKANPNYAGLDEAGQQEMYANAYNQALSEKQTQMLTDIENQVNSYRGILNSDIYGNLLKGRTLQDNADWRKASLGAQIANNQALRDLQRANYEAQEKEREREALRDVRDYNFKVGQAGFDNFIKSEKLKIDKLKAETTTKEEKQNAQKLGDIQAVEQQINNFTKTFKNLPGKLYTNTIGVARDKTGLQDKNQAQFNSQRTLLFNKIARDLGGEKGVLSDQDIKRIENSLPKYTDSYEQKMAKMNAIYDLLSIQKARYNVSTQAADNDPLGIL